MNSPSTVAIVSTAERDVRAAVAEAMELARWRDFVPQGAKVALKPNLCWDLALPGAQTSPWVFEGVVEVLFERTDDIVVVEADQVTVDGDKALERTGVGAVVRLHELPFVNMSKKGEFYRSKLPDAFVLEDIELPKVLEDRILITLPVLKTHGTTYITGALKNQWGCLRKLRHNFHLVVDEAIADLNTHLRPAFAVMDGTVGMEGSGPKTGSPKVADLVLASSDLVALDTVAARVMGFEPSRASHISLAARRGLGTSRAEEILLAGDAFGEEGIPEGGLRFRPPSQNFMVKMEFWLRHSFLRKVAFETQFLSLLAFAAKMWNWLWYQTTGKKERRRILQETRYGAQWRDG